MPPIWIYLESSPVPIALFSARRAGGQNKESEEATWVPPSWYLGDWVVLTFKLSRKLPVTRLQRNSDKPLGPWGFPLITHLGWWPFFLSPYNCTAQSLMPRYLLYHLLDAHMSYLSIKLEDLVNFWKPQVFIPIYLIQFFRLQCFSHFFWVQILPIPQSAAKAISSQRKFL